MIIFFVINHVVRPEEMEELNSKNLTEEIADVILTAILFAKSTDADIEKALDLKIKK
jgi:NTP pyrophosphatase (non-canonical NTP hydrolase)